MTDYGLIFWLLRVFVGNARCKKLSVIDYLLSVIRDNARQNK